MRRWCSFVVLLLAVTSLGVCASSRVARSILDLPGGWVEISRSSKYWSIEYCPDNTCDLIRVSGSVSEADVGLLALGYFVYFSPYTYLAEWQKSRRLENSIRDRIAGMPGATCPSSSEEKVVACRLRSLAKAGQLRIFSVRFDEGRETVTPLPIQQALRLANP